MLEIKTPTAEHALPAEGSLTLTGKTAGSGLFQIILDEQVIGYCFHHDNVIHWTVPKQLLAPSTITKATWLLQSANLELLKRCREMAT